MDTEALEARLAQRLQHRQATAIAPRTDAEARMLDIWHAAFGHAGFGVEDDFHAIGGDSLIALAVCERVKSSMGRDVPASRLHEHPSVASLCRWMARGAPHDSQVLHPLSQAGEDDGRYYIVHGADGEVERFRLLARALPGGATGVGFDIENPRLAAAASLDALADVYAQAIDDHCPHATGVLVGWSLGGSVALATARALQARAARRRSCCSTPAHRQ